MKLHCSIICDMTWDGVSMDDGVISNGKENEEEELATALLSLIKCLIRAYG